VSGLRVERDGGVVIVTLDRPEALNALTVDMVDGLRAAIAAADADATARAILLTGEGRAFCSGVDLRGPATAPKQLLTDHYNPLIRAMRAVRLPIVCAINGAVAGVGVALALASDLRVAAAGAYVSLAFSQVGLVPDGGLTWLLPRAVGLGRAMELAALGRRLTADEALGWGLVNQVAADADLAAVASEMARTLAEGPASFGAMKRAFDRGQGGTLDAALAREADLQEAATATEDFLEAMRAFREKRRPVFTGR
jgi:2-(1,2-epoxy-1,2-dihydrophenyl)acetyl-CoA isomerase